MMYYVNACGEPDPK